VPVFCQKSSRCFLKTVTDDASLGRELTINKSVSEEVVSDNKPRLSFEKLELMASCGSYLCCSG